MGMPDTVYISAEYDWECPKCQHWFVQNDWQTKDFGGGHMETFIIERDRLWFLRKPDENNIMDRARFWHKYTPKEIEANIKKWGDGPFSILGENTGEWKKEAFNIENRDRLPPWKGWRDGYEKSFPLWMRGFTMHSPCPGCQTWIDIQVRFDDKGILKGHTIIPGEQV